MRKHEIAGGGLMERQQKHPELRRECKLVLENCMGTCVVLGPEMEQRSISVYIEGTRAESRKNLYAFSLGLG
jgi:hypothetical protein